MEETKVKYECHASNPDGDGYDEKDESCIFCMKESTEYAIECKQLTEGRIPQKVEKLKTQEKASKYYTSHSGYRFKVNTVRGMVYDLSFNKNIPDAQIIQKLMTDCGHTKQYAKRKLWAVKNLANSKLQREKELEAVRKFTEGDK